MNSNIKTIAISVAISVVLSIAAVCFIEERKSSKTDNLIKDFYYTENAVHVSPHGLRKKMDQGDDSFILVDLRSQEEYEKEHVIGAVNIPAYADPDRSAYNEVDRIVNEFRELSEDKTIIVYCYSTACMTGRKIGKMLAENDIFVAHRGIGWNEWRYAWDMWNHDGEAYVPWWDYIATGSEPGTPKVRELPSSCGGGEFDC